MSDPQLTRAFINQGLASYPAALDAVEFFELQMKEHLRRALDERKNWKNFRRAIGADGLPAQPTASSYHGSSRWLSASLEGEKRGDERTLVYVGLCWKPAKVRAPVVAYATLTAGNNRVVSIDARADRDPRIQVGAVDGKERRPYLIPGPDFDPEADFELLLEMILPRFGGQSDYAAIMDICIFNSNSIGLT